MVEADRTLDHNAPVQALPIFLTLADRPAILVGEGPAADAKRRLLERAGARIVDEAAAARIAIVVGDEAAVARLRARGILVNMVDRPDLSDFTMPAIVDRAPVTVAIGTGGVSAGLAKALRQRIEAALPADLGGLATALEVARAAIRDRWPDADDRRRALDAAFEGPLDPLGDGAVSRVSIWLQGADEQCPAQLIPIRLDSGDPDDLTLRAARLLGRADRLYHREDVPPAILDRARADAARIACAAAPSAPPAGLSLDLSLHRAPA